MSRGRTPKWNEEQLKNAVNVSKNISDVCINLGITHGNNYKVIRKYIEKYKINIDHFESFEEGRKRVCLTAYSTTRIPLEKCLVRNSPYSGGNSLKKKLYDSGLKKRECELCGQDENWKGKKMSLILDHINGDNKDNRIENLRIVCPNCDATLDTYKSKNKRN
jgi:hypothetical protein